MESSLPGKHLVYEELSSGALTVSSEVSHMVFTKSVLGRALNFMAQKIEWIK
jgi:hypothetical protein